MRLTGQWAAKQPSEVTDDESEELETLVILRKELKNELIMLK